MALTTNTTSQENSVSNIAVGKVVTDAGAAAITTFLTGFKPRYIRFVNITDRIEYEWYDGMTEPGALKTVAAGTRTLETTEGPTVLGPGTAASAASAIAGGVVGNGFSVPTSVILASKTFAWEAKG